MRLVRKSTPARSVAVRSIAGIFSAVEFRKEVDSLLCRDTLTRHLQVHDKSRKPAEHRRKSCRYCSKCTSSISFTTLKLTCDRSKIRCSGTQPSCSSCMKRGVECHYFTPQWMRTDPTLPVPQSPNLSSVGSFGIQNAVNSLQDMATDSICGPGILVPESPIEASRQERDIIALTDMNPYFNQSIAESQSLLLNGDFNFDALGFPELSNFDQDTSLDWMFRSVDDNNISMPLGGPASSNHLSEENMVPFQVPPRQYNAQPMSNDHTPQPDCDEATSQLEQPSYRPRNRCTPDDPWPMEWYAVHTQRSELPMLGRPEEPDPNAGSYFGMDPISSSTREKMKDTARLAFERTLWPSINLDKFPSGSKLDHCVDLYFAHFHLVSFRFYRRHDRHANYYPRPFL
jgi:hypothetical protein